MKVLILILLFFFCLVNISFADIPKFDGVYLVDQAGNYIELKPLKQSE